jgi:hypothetical protein
MKAYKGFDKNLKCRDFQYEIGGTYEESEAMLCKTGFHACEHPLDVFGYYPPAESRYAEVDLDATSETEPGDTKRCGRKISIKAELNLQGIIQAAIDFVFEQSDKKKKTKHATGVQGAASATGKEAIAFSAGIEGRAKAAKGNFIVCSEWAEESDGWHRVAVKAIRVDGKKIKADTWYQLKDGKFIEVSE